MTGEIFAVVGLVGAALSIVVVVVIEVKAKKDDVRLKGLLAVLRSNKETTNGSGSDPIHRQGN